MPIATNPPKVVSDMHSNGGGVHVVEFTEPSSLENVLPKSNEQNLAAFELLLGKVKLGMQSVLQYLRKGKNLGPLTVFAIVLIYALLSPHLPAPLRDYIYHIAH